MSKGWRRSINKLLFVFISSMQQSEYEHREGQTWLERRQPANANEQQQRESEKRRRRRVELQLLDEVNNSKRLQMKAKAKNKTNMEKKCLK